MKYKDRYLRQVMISQVGDNGQERLKSSTAVVVGCGGLASPVLTYLAAAGVGNIVLIDSDIIAMTDLNRQFLYEERDIGFDKCFCAKEFIRRRNSDICVRTVDSLLDDKNAEQLLRGAQVVIDCVDNDQTRIWISRTCRKLQIPVIEGGICGFYGYVLPVQPGNSACIECLRYDNIFREEATIPVIGAIAGVIGSLQAMEGIKVLLGLEMNYGVMIYYDGLETEFTKIQVKVKKDCICNQTK